MSVHTCRDVASVVGVLWLSLLTLRVLKTLAGDFCAFFLALLGISRMNLKKYGSWAGRATEVYIDLVTNVPVTKYTLNLYSDYRSFRGNWTRLCP